MASIQEIVARRSPVASLPQASPNPNTGVGITSDAGSGGFRQLGQVRGIPLNTATGFGEAGMIDANSVGAIGQTIGQIATAVDELNEASEKARLVSVGKLAGKKIEEWNSISDETQREEFRVKQVEPALARINSQRKGLTNIANNTRNAFVSEMGILGNAHKLNAAKSNGYIELSKLRIELDAAKGLDKEEMIDRYRSLSTSLITSGVLDPKEALTLGQNTQAILKTSTETGLTEEYQGLIQNVPDNEINNVIEKLQKEGKGYVFSEDSEFRVLEKALDKSPVFRAKLLEDERTRRLEQLQDYVKEATAKEQMAFTAEQDHLEEAKSSIRAKMNDYEGGDVAGFTDDLLKEYDGYSNTFKKKLRAEADTALRIGVTLRSMKSKSLKDAAILELLAPDENGGPDIFQAFTNAQDKNKFIDAYLSSPASEEFRNLLESYGYNPEVVGRSYFRLMALTPEASKSASDFKTPRDTIHKNFIADAKNIITKNRDIEIMSITDSQAIPNIMRQVTAKAIQIREANPKLDDYKKALNDFQKTFGATPRVLLKEAPEAAGIPRAISGEPVDIETIEKNFKTLSPEKQSLVPSNIKNIINPEMLRNPKLIEKVATGKATNPADLFSPLGQAVLRNPNVPKAKKAELLTIAITSAQKIHQVEVEKVESLRGQPQEISDVFPDGVRTPTEMQQFANTHTQAEDFPIAKKEFEGFEKGKPVEDQESMFMGFARQLGKLVTGDANFELPDMNDIGKGLGSRDSRIDRQAATAKAMEFAGKNTQWNEDTQSWEPVKEATPPAAIPTEPTPEAGAVRIESDSDVPTTSESDGTLSDTSQGAQGGGPLAFARETLVNAVTGATTPTPTNRESLEQTKKSLNALQASGITTKEKLDEYNKLKATEKIQEGFIVDRAKGVSDTNRELISKSSKNVYESSTDVPQKDKYFGDAAVKKYEEMKGPKYKATDEEKLILRFEGLVEAFYLDTEGVMTYGVGQTGDNIFDGKKPSIEKFSEIIPTYRKRAKDAVGKTRWAKLTQELKNSLTLAAFRGDIKGSHQSAKKIESGNYKEAAKHFIDNWSLAKALDYGGSKEDFGELTSIRKKELGIDEKSVIKKIKEAANNSRTKNSIPARFYHTYERLLDEAKAKTIKAGANSKKKDKQ
jgi:GH24 family phage-related lysozyme (muramidase)/DNA-binding ferritin-like protein (Dps family)